MQGAIINSYGVSIGPVVSYVITLYQDRQMRRNAVFSQVVKVSIRLSNIDACMLQSNIC